MTPQSFTPLICSDGNMRSSSRFFPTISLFAVYFSAGLTEYIYGPTLLDLGETTGTSVSVMSIGLALYTCGYCAGCVLFGWMFHRTDRRKGLIFCIVVSALTTIITPVNKNTYLLLVNILVSGLFKGGVDVGTNAWMMQLWKKEANPFMLAMHSLYALSLALVPVITAPYVAITADPATGRLARDSHITVPYTVVSVVPVVPVVMLLLLPYIYEEDTSQAVDAISSPQLASQIDVRAKKSCRQITLTTLSLIVMGSYAGMELVFLLFLPQFGVFSNLHMDRATGAFVASICTICIAVVKTASIWLAVKVSARNLIIADFTVTWTGLLLLSVFGNDYQSMLWFSAAVVGMGIGSCFPSLLSFLGQEVDDSCLMTGCLLAAGRLPAIPLEPLVGSFIESTPNAFAYLCLGSVSVSCIAFVVLLLMK